MEAITLFAATVGLVSGIHLVSTASEYLGRGRYYSGNSQGKREDWYCFFKPSELLGEDWNTSKGEEEQATLTEAERLEQARRREANRPRLQA